MAPLLYPPHNVAVASIYLAGVLLSFESTGNAEDSTTNYRTNAEVADLLGKTGHWESRYHCRLEDVQGRDVLTPPYSYLFIVFLQKLPT